MKVLGLIVLSFALVSVAVAGNVDTEERFFLTPEQMGANLPDSYTPIHEVMNFTDADLATAFQGVITMEGDVPMYTPTKMLRGTPFPNSLRASVGLKASYSQANAFQFARYAAAAYCVNKNNGDSVLKWTCSACKEVPKLSDIKLFRHTLTNTNAYVGYLASSSTIIVSFAGTEMTSIRNWITDLIFKHVDYPRCSGCQVHLGFYNAFLTVGNDIIAYVKTLRSKYPSSAVSVTGHSLGGALATHALFALSANSVPLRSPVYSFGQPRVGNLAFAKAFDARVDQFRLVHYKDPVPQVPLVGMDFAHSPVEIYYQNGENSYKQCSSTNGEDTTCSYKTTLPWLPDATYHLQYGKFDFSAKTC